MKTLSVKVGLFGIYLSALLLAWSSPGPSGFMSLTAKITLIYCGLIVVAHLAAALLQLCRRCGTWWPVVD